VSCTSQETGWEDYLCDVLSSIISVLAVLSSSIYELSRPSSCVFKDGSLLLSFSGAEVSRAGRLLCECRRLV